MHDKYSDLESVLRYWLKYFAHDKSSYGGGSGDYVYANNYMEMENYGGIVILPATKHLGDLREAYYEDTKPYYEDKPLAGTFFADDNDIDEFRKQFPLFSEKLILLYERFLKELKRYLNNRDEFVSLCESVLGIDVDDLLDNMDLNYIHKYHTNNIINFI